MDLDEFLYDNKSFKDWGHGDDVELRVGVEISS
jgi:hypothetical protein